VSARSHQFYSLLDRTLLSERIKISLLQNWVEKGESNCLIFCAADIKLSLWKYLMSVWRDADFRQKFALHPLEFS
jgi:hypothetical protein